MTKRLRLIIVGLFFALVVASTAANYSSFFSVRHMVEERGWNAFPSEPGGPELVNQVRPDGPATVLQVGDEIVAINGQNVERSDYKTENAFRGVNTGDSYSLTVRRDGQVRDLALHRERVSFVWWLYARTAFLFTLLNSALFLLIGVSLWVFYHDPRLVPDQVFSKFIVTYLPTGVLGLVIAAIFSAAMSTLSGSLNSSASAIVNDLYRPLSGRTDEAHLLRVSRAMTAVWGVVLMAVALGATRLQDNVVNNALAIASFVTGILLGLFLLGILTRRVGQSAALVGMLAGVVAVSFAKFGTPLAWPWYALVGSSTVFAVGLASSYLVPGSPGFRVPETLSSPTA